MSSVQTLILIKSRSTSVMTGRRQMSTDEDKPSRSFLLSKYERMAGVFV